MKPLTHMLKMLVIVGLMGWAPARPVLAGGVVGSGTPGSCSEAALATALVGGGSVSFNCGAAPVTIGLTSAKSIVTSTTIDGGGTITLSGQDSTRLFMVSNGATLTLRNIVLTNGYSADNGGAIHNGALSGDTPGAVVLENSTIRNSVSSLSGGAIVSTGPLTITNSLLENNRAKNGGALFPRFANAKVTLTNSTLRGNIASYMYPDGMGGAILVWDGASVSVTGGDFYGNSANLGGAIEVFTNASLQMVGSLVRNNDASYFGGGIGNMGTTTLQDVHVTGNSGFNNGGGIYSDAGLVSLTRAVIESNTSRTNGGGLFIKDGTAILNKVTVKANSAMADGGGLYAIGVVTVTESTLSSNTGGYSGGGIWLHGNGALWMWNSTIDGNTAKIDGGGLGLLGTANLYNVTVAHNVADSDDNGTGNGGGVFVDPTAALYTRNTLLAVNYRGPNPILNDCVGEVWSRYSRFTSVPVGCTTAGPAALTADPNGIGPLANNGGPTLTVALLPGSDAIDAADPIQGCVNFEAVLTTDQRGAARIADVRCDVGAFEYGSLLPWVFLPSLMH